MKRILFLVSTLTVLSLASAGASGQVASSTKLYRGSVGGRNIEMRLNIQGTSATGTYAYDGIGEALSLTGRLDEHGLQLSESVNKKPTGKFVCKKSLDDPIDSDCMWSRPDGSHEAFVWLSEQNVEITNGLKIVPKTLANRKIGLSVSYPEITNGAKALPAGAAGFNRRVYTLTQQAIKEFTPGDEAGRNAFQTNYSVLLATNDLISVEMREYSDSGGAHPNDRFWSVTYDLAANKEIDFASLFKPDSDYKMAIAKYVTADIDKRADMLEQEEAKLEHLPSKPRYESIISVEQLSEISDWAMTPRGLVFYFDFPHVIAVFDKNFIPYNALKDYLKPDSPAARFIKP